MPEPSRPILELRRVSLALDGRELFDPVSLSVAPGAAATVMGRSGAGKSSLLAYVCGSLDPRFRAGGEVLLGGASLTGLPPEKRRVAILYQDDLLFPHLSVGGNLLFAIPGRIRGRAKRWELAERALADAGLTGFMERDPATLSGGQRARVAVMRTLLARPRALLLDEPFSKLDAATRQAFRAFVLEHARARGLPVLMVTHDPADARAAGGEVLQLTGGEGR